MQVCAAVVMSGFSSTAPFAGDLTKWKASLQEREMKIAFAGPGTEKQKPALRRSMIERVYRNSIRCEVPAKRTGSGSDAEFTGASSAGAGRLDPRLPNPIPFSTIRSQLNRRQHRSCDRISGVALK